ncbi:hypothetical protein Tco_0210109 [Tanacetum coccineum]
MIILLRFSFFNGQYFDSLTGYTTSPPLDNEDLQQIDQDDLEELDIRWQVAMLTVRVQRFIRKGENRIGMGFQRKQLLPWISHKQSATNYHRKGPL